MICDASTAERIGALWLRSALAPVGDFGRRTEDAARPFGRGDEAAARAQCTRIARLAEQLEPAGVALTRTALRRAPDPAGIISRATAGDSLDDVDFFELLRFADALDATASAWDAAGGPVSGRPPVLPEVAGLLARGRLGGSFYLADTFGASLGAVRARYAVADAAATAERRRLRQLLEPLVGGDPADGEHVIVMRDAVPNVPAGVRVVRETPAYRVLTLELDTPALTAAAATDRALLELMQAEERARRELGTAVAALGKAIVLATRTLGELDCTLARVAFVQTWGGCIPDFASEPVFAFEAATFAPLAAALHAAGRNYTAISLEVSGVAVITGPNMGGKSAALATCGFLAACASAGLPPPAARITMPLFARVAWIGAEPTVEPARLLSAFGAEVVHARDVLATTDRPELVLVDEFARTTGPREGCALLVALVEALARRRASALIATHFESVARAANVAHFTIAGLARPLDAHAAADITAALDAVAHAMDYRIIVAGIATEVRSDALALAGLLGLDAAIVERAATLYAGPADGAPAEAPE